MLSAHVLKKIYSNQLDIWLVLHPTSEVWRLHTSISVCLLFLHLYKLSCYYTCRYNLSKAKKYLRNRIKKKYTYVNGVYLDIKGYFSLFKDSKCQGFAFDVQGTEGHNCIFYTAGEVCKPTSPKPSCQLFRRTNCLSIRSKLNVCFLYSIYSYIFQQMQV